MPPEAFLILGPTVAALMAFAWGWVCCFFLGGLRGTEGAGAGTVVVFTEVFRELEFVDLLDNIELTLRGLS